jgi:hypothetical protein
MAASPDRTSTVEAKSRKIVILVTVALVLVPPLHVLELDAPAAGLSHDACPRLNLYDVFVGISVVARSSH